MLWTDQQPIYGLWEATPLILTPRANCKQLKGSWRLQKLNRGWTQLPFQSCQHPFEISRVPYPLCFPGKLSSLHIPLRDFTVTSLPSFLLPGYQRTTSYSELLFTLQQLTALNESSIVAVAQPTVTTCFSFKDYVTPVPSQIHKLSKW